MEADLRAALRNGSKQKDGDRSCRAQQSSGVKPHPSEINRLQSRRCDGRFIDSKPIRHQGNAISEKKLIQSLKLLKG